MSFSCSLSCFISLSSSCLSHGLTLLVAGRAVSVARRPVRCRRGVLHLLLLLFLLFLSTCRARLPHPALTSMEQNCDFVHSGGQRYQFSLSVPMKLSAHTKWPLLVHLQGQGRGSFFSHRTTLETPGMLYAAAHFIVVSPTCDWTWNEKPKGWVNDLVDALMHVSWIDERRIYLTGSSMGGMSTLEICAARPDLYAAIAPIAAHHKADRENFLAKKLCWTPMLAISSENDEVCSIAKTRRLWTRITRKGNRNIQVRVTRGDRHNHMFERGYCDSTFLYDWLWKWTRWWKLNMPSPCLAWLPVSSSSPVSSPSVQLKLMKVGSRGKVARFTADPQTAPSEH